MRSPSGRARNRAGLSTVVRSSLLPAILLGVTLGGLPASSLAPARAAEPVLPAAGHEIPVDPTIAAAAERLVDAALSSDLAYELLGELSDHHPHRLSGSKGLEDAIDWSVARFEELGFENVRKEPVMVPTWIRGEESLTLVEPARHEMAMLGLGMSVGTPGEGIEAEVVVVDSFDDLAARPDAEIRDRIVLYDVPFQGYGRTVRYRVDGASEAARRGAVAALVRSIGPDGLRLPHTGMMRYADGVPRIPTAAVSSEDAATMRRMQERGDRIVARLRMEARIEPDRLSHNVVAEIAGREEPEEIVVIGGHIDAWDVGHGAQDDGAGCMISLAAAQLMIREGLVPRRTVRVVFWTNEENGLRGGTTYRDTHEVTLDRHVAAIESDSGNGMVQGFRFDFRPAAVGATSAEEAGEVLGRGRERGLALLRGISALLATTGADSVFAAGSGADIGPIAARGVPALGLHHDTSDYFMIHHTPADTFDRIDPEVLRRNVAAMAVMAYALAEMEPTLRP